MDCRSLFDRYTSRKPVNWAHASSMALSVKQMEALQTLPRMHIGPEVGTFDDIFNEPPAPGLVREERELEYVVIRENEASELEYYYVNTEGYTYARYVARIPDCYVIGLL